MRAANAVRQTVREFVLREFLPGEDPEALADTTPLLTEGILDSVSTLRLVAFLEERFRIDVEAHETDAENFDTIDRIVDFVCRK